MPDPGLSGVACIPQVRTRPAATQTTADTSVSVGIFDAPGIVRQALRSDGEPLTRDFFEPRFGRQLSEVRAHASSEAAASAREITAGAYTLGRDIFFGQNFYRPHSTDRQTRINFYRASLPCFDWKAVLLALDGLNDADLHELLTSPA